MATQDPITGPGRASSFLPTISSSNFQRLEDGIEMRQLLFPDASGNLQNHELKDTGIRPGSGVTVPVKPQPAYRVTNHGQHHQAENPVPQQESQQATTHNNHASPFVSGPDVEVGDRSPAGRAKGLLGLSKRAWVWVGIMVVCLTLAVVSGVVLGVVTKQIQWGFALSALVVAVIGTCVAVMGVLANLNKRE